MLVFESFTCFRSELNINLLAICGDGKTTGNEECDDGFGIDTKPHVSIRGCTDSCTKVSGWNCTNDVTNFTGSNCYSIMNFSFFCDLILSFSLFIIIVTYY
jgi:hypothetical protein